MVNEISKILKRFLTVEARRNKQQKIDNATLQSIWNAAISVQFFEII